MPSSPSSVIVVDDSSDDEPKPESYREIVSLLASSSDGSDSSSCCFFTKSRVVPPTIIIEGVQYDSDSGSKKEEEGQRPPDSKKQKRDICGQSVPHGKTKKKSAAVQLSAAIESGDGDINVETAPISFADSGGRMYSDFMSFSELQAQQREFERLQARAHRASKSIPHNTTRQTTAGSKRKAHDAMSVSHSFQTVSSLTKNMTSPFDFDFPDSSEDSSFSSSPNTKNSAAADSVGSKPMSLKDVVAQERELAQLRKEKAEKISQAEKKKPESMPKPSVPGSSLFPSRDHEPLVDETERSDDNYSKKDMPFQPEPFLKESLPEWNNNTFSDEEYMLRQPKNSNSQISLRLSIERNRERGNADKSIVSKKTSKRKKRKKQSRPSSEKTGVQVSETTQARVSLSEKLTHHRNARDTVIPGTLWRNVFFDTAPINLLPLNSNVARPFYSEFDRPLLTYDVDGDLSSMSDILPQFSESTQFVLSTLVSGKPEQIITQQDMDTRVAELIHRELPRLRACHQQKTTAILTEARAKVKTYLAARESLNIQGVHFQTHSKRLGHVAVLNKSLLNQMKHEKLPQAMSLEYSNVWGETISVEEKVFPQDVIQLPSVRPLSKCTAYIGIKSNVRVEDDPILRYKPYFGEDDDGADIDQAWYDGIEPKSSSLSIGLDGEVNELLLRQVVRECGTTEKMFCALKNISGFAQAYSDYSEIKKFDDSICLAARRIKEAKKLISRKPIGFPLAKVVDLEPSLRDNTDCQETLAERLAPPPTYFDSNMARHHSTHGYGLGLRSTDNYVELLVTYRDMFCRMCYDYHCLEHGIEHPLPSHRVDPINPPVHLSPVAFAALAKLQPGNDLRTTDRSSESCASTVSPASSTDAPDSAEVNFESEDIHSYTDKGVGREHGLSVTKSEISTVGEVTTTEQLHETRRSSRALTRISTLASRSMTMQGTRPPQRTKSGPPRVQLYPQVADESEYLNDSYYGKVTAIVKQSQQADEKCSSECWKAVSLITAADTDYVFDELKHDLKSLSDTELTLLRKLRVIIGNNPCIISSTIKSTTCKKVGAFLEVECNSKLMCTSFMNNVPLSLESRCTHNGRKRGRALSSRSSNNRILLNRTKNNCLKDKGVNHEYEPCDHEGACDSTGCSCMTRDHTCDKACSCSRSCPNRFPGCKCSLGNCRTKACPCFIAARECNPDLCVTCGASEVPALIFDKERRNMSALDLGICCNVNILRGLHKKVGVAYSATHGWGAFALEPIKRGEFIYEYHGALLSQDEAERRGSIYDKMTISFLFDVDDDSVVDAIRKGNKSKFANHSTTNKKCKGKVLTVGGEHRISIWAQQDIAKGEELFFNYGYQGETAPDWSQLRIKGGFKKKAEVEKKKRKH